MPLITDYVPRHDALVLAALGYTHTDNAGITGRHPSKIHYLTRTATTPIPGPVHGES
ncbi:hypothetical protein NCG97_36575 [Streptomyces lydicamycinicus]|uniref:hypothetical protein n=1 Tax=Streptomyces lydicamycinicus TaxID=1546107 RepID=UPI002034E997|nr:hypothetical protein [Streptomyces lydicamycinicus]USA04907.1 hypothetical protein NCG97_36575 [Streptomyces lydicamycinicus]